MILQTNNHDVFLLRDRNRDDDDDDDDITGMSNTMNQPTGTDPN